MSVSVGVFPHMHVKNKKLGTSSNGCRTFQFGDFLAPFYHRSLGLCDNDAPSAHSPVTDFTSKCFPVKVLKIVFFFISISVRCTEKKAFVSIFFIFLCFIFL